MRKHRSFAGTTSQHRSGAAQGFREARAYLADARAASSCAEAMTFAIEAAELAGSARAEREWGGRYKPAREGGSTRRAVIKVIRQKCKIGRR